MGYFSSDKKNVGKGARCKFSLSKKKYQKQISLFVQGYIYMSDFITPATLSSSILNACIV